MMQVQDYKPFLSYTSVQAGLVCRRVSNHFISKLTSRIMVDDRRQMYITTYLRLLKLERKKENH